MSLEQIAVEVFTIFASFGILAIAAAWVVYLVIEKVKRKLRGE